MLPTSFQTPGKPKYDPLPEGLYRVVIEDVNAFVRTKYKSKTGEQEHALKFTFLIADGEFVGRRLLVDASAIFTEATNGKQASKLYSIWRAANKNPAGLDKELLAMGLPASELNALIGKQLTLVVGQKPPKDGQVYNEIRSYMASTNDLPKDRLPEMHVKDPEPLPEVAQQGAVDDGDPGPEDEDRQPTDKELSDAGLL